MHLNTKLQQQQYSRVHCCIHHCCRLPASSDDPTRLELDDVGVGKLLEQRNLAQGRSRDTIVLQLHLDFLLSAWYGTAAPQHRGSRRRASGIRHQSGISLVAIIVTCLAGPRGQQFEFAKTWSMVDLLAGRQALKLARRVKLKQKTTNERAFRGRGALPWLEQGVGSGWG